MLVIVLLFSKINSYFCKKKTTKMNNLSVDQLHLLTLNVGYARHYADWNWKHVRSPFARLYYVTEGSAEVELPTGIYPLRPGCLYLIPPFTMHSYICNGTFSHYYIHIFEEQEGDVGMLEDWEYPFEVSASPTDLQLMERLCEMNPQMRLPQSDPESYDNHATLMGNLQRNLERPFSDKVESRGILYILFSRFLHTAVKKSRVRDSRISQTLSVIRKNLDKRIDLADLADNACMSKDHFIRMFRKEVGETPNSYIISKKIERAELLLVTTTLPVKQIASTLGYDDFAYFNRQFKHKTGKTPLQYRG